MIAADSSLFTGIFAGLLDLLYPPKCLLCDVLGEEILCLECAESLIVPVPTPYCTRCGQVQQGVECGNCADYPSPLIRCRAVGVLEGNLAELIYQFKYRDRPMLAKPLAQIMANYLRIRAEIMNDLRFDAIVPVPLHKVRERRRGYNQSERLAKELSAELDIPLAKNVLLRSRNTKPQVGKQRTDRLKNLEGAFSGNSQRCHGKSFLLVDDVSTTGSTISRSAKALIDAGAKEVYAITMAIG